MIKAKERRCDTNMASSFGISWSIVCSYSFLVTITLAAASSSLLQHRFARNSLTSP